MVSFFNLNMRVKYTSNILFVVYDVADDGDAAAVDTELGHAARGVINAMAKHMPATNTSLEPLLSLIRASTTASQMCMGRPSLVLGALCLYDRVVVDPLLHSCFDVRL